MAAAVLPVAWWSADGPAQARQFFHVWRLIQDCLLGRGLGGRLVNRLFKLFQDGQQGSLRLNGLMIRRQP